MNEERILKLADHLDNLDLLDEPGEFDMNTYAFTECGTPGCIAGHAAYIFTDASLEDLLYKAFDIAEEALELDFGIAKDLFIPGNVKWNYVKAKDAVGVLRNLAETGEVKWPNHVLKDGYREEEYEVCY